MEITKKNKYFYSTYFSLLIIRYFLYSLSYIYIPQYYMKNPHILFILTILCAFFTTIFSNIFLQGIGFYTMENTPSN